MTGKFKRGFAGVAVVNDPNHMWGGLHFDVSPAGPANEKGK